MYKQIAALRGLNFTYYATTVILQTFLPLYFVTKGYTSSQVGILMMIGPFIAMFAQPVWGYVSDWMQSVKWIILTLWSLTIVSSFFLFSVSGFTLTFVFVLLLFFFMLPSIPLLDSMAIQSIEGTNQSYASIRMFGSLGFCIVAVLVGLLVPLVGGVEHIDKLYWIFWIFPIPILIFGLRDVKSEGPRISVNAIGILLRNRLFLWYLLMVFILMIPHRANDVLFGLYIHQNGAPNWLLSASWAIAALSELPGFMLANRLLRRYHELALLGIVGFLYAIRWVLYAIITNPWALFALQSLNLLTFSLFWIIAIHYTTRLVPEQLRSTGQSILSAVFLGLAGIAGGYVGGTLLDHWGGFGLYGMGAIISSLAAIMFIGTHAYLRRTGSMNA